MKISKQIVLAAVLVAVPALVLAQSTSAGGVPGGLQKATDVVASTQKWLLGVSAIVISIAAIGTGIAIAFQKKRWEDISHFVIGAIVVAVALPLANWIIA